MSWLQLRISIDRDGVGRVERALTHVGALSITLEDHCDQPIFEPALGETPLWQTTRVTGLFPADIDVQGIAAEAATVAKIPIEQTHWHVLEDKDWEREWMRHYHPIQCSERFWVCPSWLEPPDPSAVNLMLDPGLAFGTGTHPTTLLCLQWLTTQTLQHAQVLDFGCGSGILGIAALLQGAESACGVDIDPQALSASRQNAQRNALDPARFPVFFPSALPQHQYDCVLANILAGPLVELSSQLIGHMKPGAALCLSGVLASQQQAVVEAYEADIEFTHRAEKDNWIVVAGNKRR